MFTSNAIFVWAVLGLFLGFVVHFIPFGSRPLGWISSSLLGMTGAMGGGGLAFCMHGGDVLRCSALLMSILGAITLLMVLGVESPDLKSRYHNAYRITRH